MVKKINKIKYLNILSPILVFLLLLALLLFVINSLQIASETNRNNFEYIIKIRDIDEEVDKLMERAAANVNVLADVISNSYDTSKRKDKKYNINYLKNNETLAKSVLINSPGTDGSWFLLNADLPFSYKIYNWFGNKNGKIVDIREELEEQNLNDRKLNPTDDPYYFKAVQAKKMIWSDIYTDADTKVQMMTIAEPIYKDDVLIGVAGVDVSIKNFKQTLKNMQATFADSEIFLLDNHKKIIFEQLSDNRKIQKGDSSFLKLFDKKAPNKEIMVEYINNGTKRIAIKLSMTNNYNLVITFPNMLIFKIFERLFRIIYFILTVLVILVVINMINRNKIIKMNRKLKNEVSTIRNIVKYSPTLMCIKDEAGIYLNCNEWFAEIVGQKKEDIIGKTDYNLFDKKEADLIIKKNIEAKNAKKCIIDEVWYDCANGERKLLEKYIIPLLDENDEIIGILVNAIDLTKRYQEQEQLEKAKEDAETATRMKSNFLANMSHEIRTPMNGLLGFLQLLEDTNLTEQQKKFIMNAQKSSEFLLNIINEILDFSKIEVGKLKIDNISFDLRRVVEDVILMNMPCIQKKGLSLNSSIDSDIPLRVFGDSGKVKQILNNLVSNAIKFTKEGGVIVCIKQISEENNKILLNFEVEDTGIGISENKLNLIFESFTQADASTTRKYGGTGLGLTISQKLAELMGGHIRVDSKLNEGSTFTLELTFQVDASSNITTNSDNSINIAKENEFDKHIKILIVEDTDLNCKFISTFLENLGMSCEVAFEGENAVEAFKTKKYDLILMDCQMPIMDGYEATREIRKIEGGLSHIPIIAMTANAMNIDKKKCYEAGMDDYISKPINTNELLCLIKKHIQLNSKSTEVYQKLANNYINNIVEQLILDVGFTRVEAIQMFDKFLEFLIQSIAEIEMTLEENDFVNLKSIAHKLKGSSANLRVEEITQLSKQLENGCLTEDKEFCIDVVEKIKKHSNCLNSLRKINAQSIDEA